MSTTVHAVGFKPPDERWTAMKAVWDSCTTAQIPVPREVDRFFEGNPPDDQGVLVEEGQLVRCGAAREFSTDSSSGFEIFVKHLPADVAVVRVYMSW